jgi:osmotically-inducible protein OsmY
VKTDRQLQQDVLDELKWEPSVEASAIGVEVKDGIVTLAGHVDSYVQKVSAEHAAQRVFGVKGVVMEIDIALPGSSKLKDADLARNASHALEWNASVPDNAIKISVQDGWVTLAGEVNWAYQRWAAIRAVRDLIGVVGVNDHITIKPHVEPRDVKTKIQAALQRHAHQESKSIDVGVNGSRVTLTGVVDSWAERDVARLAAWAAPGVNEVIDNMRVAA